MAYKVTFRGVGQLNGPVPIYKTLEYDDYMGKQFLGAGRDEAIVEALNNFYPGVKINPRLISVNTSLIKTQKKTTKQKETSKSIFRKPYIFIPFRLLFKLMGYIWRTTLKD